MKKLGVNIDHVATLRNVRGGSHPNILETAKYAMKSGANSITIHLREDRRHINDQDVLVLTKNKKIPINLEISLNPKIIDIALKMSPNYICIVPEKRKEITTEGGLNLEQNKKQLQSILLKFKKKKIRTSLFIDPKIKDVNSAFNLKTDCIELHTGKISELIKSKKRYSEELIKIKKCCKLAKKLGLEIHAGHGLDYETTQIISKINEIREFNIGHFIIGESIFHGLKKIIKKFKTIIKI